MKVVCQHFKCGASGEVPGGQLGQRVQCPSCGSVFTLLGQAMSPVGCSERPTLGWRIYRSTDLQTNHEQATNIKGKTMGLFSSLFGRSKPAPQPTGSSQLPLASEVTEKQSMDLLRPQDIYALVAVVPQGTAGPQSDQQRQDYVWALYEAASPKLCQAIKGDRNVIRAHYFESPHMRRGELLGSDHWFDAQEHYRLPGVYSSLIHFLSIQGDLLRFRLRDPSKPAESKFDVRVPTSLLPVLAAGPSDVTLITVFTSNKPICIPTMWPLRPKIG